MTSQALPPALSDALARAESLPSLPAVAVEVLRLTESEDGTIEDLARTIQNDPALSAKLLKLSNSSLFNLGQEVTTMRGATMVLGMKTVKLMSLSFSLAAALPQHGAGAFDFASFWRRSLVAAVAGRSLAELVGLDRSDEAFLCGLLSHIGQLVLSQCLTEGYAPVLERCGDRWPTLQAERKVLGVSSAEVAGVLLERWKLPEAIRVPVTCMHQPHLLPRETGEDLRQLTFVMAVTALAVSVLCEEDDGRAGRKLSELMDRRFGIPADEVDAWLIGLESGVRETAEMLNVALPSGLDHRTLVERARQQIVNLSIGATADLRVAERRADDLFVRNRELLDRALRDKLTGLHNRAAFDETLAKEIDERRQPGMTRCLGLIMVDVDRFKRFNDTHGHLAGDAVLAAVGATLAGLTRKGDLAARYGGEEFAVILPATTPGHLRAVAERIRRAIEEHVVVFEGRELRVTASLGGACLLRATGPQDGAALIKAADECLYRAKREGRNRTAVGAELLGDSASAA